MKACAQCQRLFDDDAGFCPIDGTGLRPVAEVEVPAEKNDPRIGATICGERYQVRRKVADGGMGRVYQALDVQLQRSVALKVLHEDVARDEVAVERFRREFSLSAQLPHDHIVEVFDFQNTEDHSYALVMEYLEGEELRMLLKRERRLSAERVIRMLSQLAIGLDGAHRRRFVHRDIKPDNVFLCGRAEGDLIKLLDFGSVRDNTEGAKKLTVMGTTIGSPYYMSPEQAQGLRELDHRADVWSVAAIAYECLTGTLPFQGKTGPQILLAILGDEPQPPSITGREYGVPETVDDVMAEALTKDMNIRVGSLGELADRFGAAYGLLGSHPEWVRQSEDDIKQAVSDGLQRARAAAASQPQASAQALAMVSAPGAPAPVDQASGSGAGQAFDNDEDFAMGVPQGPPWGALIPIGVTVAAILGGIAYLLLR